MPSVDSKPLGGRRCCVWNSINVTIFLLKLSWTEIDVYAFYSTNNVSLIQIVIEMSWYRNLKFSKSVLSAQIPPL